MSDFMKCEKCREEYLALGGSGQSRCPNCGAFNVADRLKPRPTATTDWACTKCKESYRTAEASEYSQCPKCGHRNKNIESTSRPFVGFGYLDTNDDTRLALGLEPSGEEKDRRKANAAAYTGLVAGVAVGFICRAVLGFEWVGTVIATVVSWLVVTVIVVGSGGRKR